MGGVHTHDQDIIYKFTDWISAHHTGHELGACVYSERFKMCSILHKWGLGGLCLSRTFGDHESAGSTLVWAIVHLKSLASPSSPPKRTYSRQQHTV